MDVPGHQMSDATSEARLAESEPINRRRSLQFLQAIDWPSDPMPSDTVDSDVLNGPIRLAVHDEAGRYLSWLVAARRQARDEVTHGRLLASRIGAF